MPDINTAAGSRATSQVTAAVLLFGAGVSVLPLSFGVLFTSRSWGDLIFLGGLLAIAPLGVLSLFKPRAVACVSVATWALVSTPFLVRLSYSGEGPDPLAARRFIILTIALLGASVLLFYASAAPRHAGGGR